MIASGMMGRMMYTPRDSKIGFGCALAATAFEIRLHRSGF